MKYVFYVDIFFVINFCMDFILLKITGKLLKENIHTTSYVWGAFLGATGLLMHVLSPWKRSMVGKIFAYILLSFIMCSISFSVRNIRRLMKIWGIFISVAFITGGMLNAMYFYNKNLLTFSVLVLLSYIILSRGSEYLRGLLSKTGTENDILNVELHHHGIVVSLKALYDSGNSLSEPISGKEVHIVDYETAYTILKGGRETEDKIRVIPYRSLGKSDGMMTAFECQELVIEVKGNKISIGPAYIGIYRGALSAGKKYSMILNRSINKWL